MKSKRNLGHRITQILELQEQIAGVADKSIEYDFEKYKNRWEYCKELEEKQAKIWHETLEIYGKPETNES